MTRLCTNRPRTPFSVDLVSRLYRFRWQIELCFKEWKSYANLHEFDTANAEGSPSPPVAWRCVRAISSTGSWWRCLAASAYVPRFVEASPISSGTPDAPTSIAIDVPDVYERAWASWRSLK